MNWVQQIPNLSTTQLIFALAVIVGFLALMWILFR